MCIRDSREVVEHPVALNVGDLDAYLPVLEAKGAISRDGEAFVADLVKAGVDRLLGKGSSERTWKVIVAHATRHAREKVTVVEPPSAPAPSPP